MEKNTLQNALNELSKGTTDNIDSIMIRDAAGNQYWIEKSDLASVLGELLEISSMLKLTKWSAYINAGTSKKINDVNGLVFIRVGYSFGGYFIYNATFGKVNIISNPAGYNLSIELTIDTANVLTIKNTADGQRYIEILYQSLP